jgi:peptide/nickel transport system permease protein
VPQLGAKRKAFPREMRDDEALYCQTDSGHDPAAVIAGDYANPQDIERICQKLGLDAPLYRQFGTWVGQLLRGDLGTSIYSGLPVTQLITQRLEPTLALSVMTMMIAIGLAIPLGTLGAWKAGTWIDRG